MFVVTVLARDSMGDASTVINYMIDTCKCIKVLCMTTFF